MEVPVPTTDVDTGKSYQAAPQGLQRILDRIKSYKLRARREKPALFGNKYNAEHPTVLPNLSALLDDLIEFEYHPAIIKSAWRRIKKPSYKTLNKIRKSEGKDLMTYRKLTPHVEDIAEKLSKFQFSRKGDLIEFQEIPRNRNAQGEFSPQGEGAPDSNAMHLTYRVAPSQPGMAPDKEGLLPNNAKQLATVAALGGAAGTLGSEAVKGGGKALAHLAGKLKSRFRK